MDARNIALRAMGYLFMLPAVFFAYYTVRLIWVNLSMSANDAAAHRTGGMLIGAIAFPLATIVFALFSWFCISRARK